MTRADTPKPDNDQSQADGAPPPSQPLRDDPAPQQPDAIPEDDLEEVEEQPS